VAQATKGWSSLVERNGKARSVHITGKMFDGFKDALRDNVPPDARLNTDDARIYRNIAKSFAEHLVVNHSTKEYVNGSMASPPPIQSKDFSVSSSAA
jgi:hypothetical protein